MKKTLILASILALTIPAAIASPLEKMNNCPAGKFQKMECSCNPGDIEAHKQRMEARKAKFEKRLNLTEEQKVKAKELRLKGHEEMKPLIMQLCAKNEQKKALIEKQCNKAEMIKLNGEIRTLKTQIRELHKKNIAEFEKILTKNQKNELQKMKKEGKKKYEKKHNQSLRCPQKNCLGK